MTAARASVSPLAATRSTSTTSERSLETLGLWMAIVAFVLVGVVAIPILGLGSAPIAGEGSVGQYAAIASAVTAIIVFIGGRLVVDDSTRSGRIGVLDIIDIAAFAFAHAVIALLGWTLTATILEFGFIDAVVFPLPVLLLSGAAAALTAYVVFLSATHLDLQLLAIVLATFLAFGVIASMLTASDPHWWQDNLSALGMTDDLSARTFNLTLIVAGILVTTLARYATQEVPTSHPRGIGRVRTCLIIVGVFLGLVGVFPVDEFFGIHTGVASGMAVAFSILVFALRRWIPRMPSTFLLLGYLFVAVIVTLAVLFGIGYYTLTAVELVAGLLVFTWIILFIRNADALRRDAEAGGSGSPIRG
ncbi:DUF998 domain-containing protein [Microbacterium sp. NPDC056234]|uniref:DUF998 domain-containing protein n=1 Tax=Microbacterium sp. NPDC056234 TaxID=3345757 RepID=UPI0035D984CF